MQQTYLDIGHLIVDVSRSHTDTPRSVGLLRIRNGPSQRPLPD